MSDLPRGRIQPVPPPPGQFDSVLSRARYRRHRRAGAVLTVSAVFLAGVAGGFALDRPVTSVPGALIEYASGGDDGGDDVGGAPVSTVSPTTSATVTQDSRKDGRRGEDKPARDPVVVGRSPAVQSPAPPGTLAVKGKAVGTAGQPAAGLYIYPGVPGTDGFVPTSQPVGRTAGDGTFSLSCTRTPILLSPWPLNGPAGKAAGTASWAATFVGGVTDARSALDAGCSRKGRLTRTIVQPGSSIVGEVDFPGGCATETLSLWLWLSNDRALSVRLKDLRDGDSYRIGGLPPGQHTLGANGKHSTVSVGGGETLARDVAFGCEGSPPEPLPTGTGTPLPIPSGTGEPTPSESATSEPGPSGASPDPSSSSTGSSSPSNSAPTKGAGSP